MAVAAAAGRRVESSGVQVSARESSTVRPGTARAVITGSNYIRQIEQLRSQARPRRLAQLDRIEMTVLLMSALQVSGAHDIPPGPGGANILLDLLSFFYRSPRAVDVFHGRSIGALSCRDSMESIVRLRCSRSPRDRNHGCH